MAYQQMNYEEKELFNSVVTLVEGIAYAVKQEGFTNLTPPIEDFMQKLNALIDKRVEERLKAR